MADIRRLTRISDTGFLRLPKGTTAERSNPQAGSVRFNTDTNELEYYNNDGQWWGTSIPFESRTIISWTYMVGGYKSSVAWSNANRTMVSTDTTINLGDGRIRAFNYQPGACSKNTGFVFGAGGAHNVSSNYVSGFNMRSEQMATHQARWDMQYSRRRYGATFQEHYYAWTNGGGASSNVEEFNLTSETRLGTPTSWTSSGDTWAASTEAFGFFWVGNTTEQKYIFSTRTILGRGSGTGVSNDGMQKSVQSKKTDANGLWCGNEGSYSGGNQLRRTNWTTDTTSGTVAKPSTGCGEENFTMGQDHQYMLGQYNGLQNNISWRFNYHTESGFLGGTTMEPKGHAGSSSGVCFWRD